MDINYLAVTKNYPDLYECSVTVIGLGYVGLPLAVEFAKRKKCNVSGKLLSREVIGFDNNLERIEELKNGYDRTGEVSKDVLSKIYFSNLTNEISEIANSDVFLVTVPTPIDDFKKPDLTALKNACTTIGKALRIKFQNGIKTKNRKVPVIIFESTVYPGTTEEICIPIIKKELNDSLNFEKNHETFVYGYSPERINPGDKEHTLIDIKKVTSGNNDFSANWIKNFYGSIIKAGIYPAQSIKVAEAAKIIENTQRDINIALINELSIIFNLMGIDTLDVIDAASSKWNFIKFKPGLVGGHCIGVDPYYLTYKSELLGYSPEIVLAGRRINDGMAKWVAEQMILEMLRKNIKTKNSKILILGFTFKEDCPDIRNTKVIDIIKTLMKYKSIVEVVDPIANIKDAKKGYNINLINEIPKNIKYDVILCAVAHKQFKSIQQKEWSNLLRDNGIIFDLKGIIPRELKPFRL